MQFTVTPQYLADAASSCQNTASEIAAQLQALKAKVYAIEATYHGVAADTFQALMTDYDVFSNMLNQALVDIGSGLQGNQVNYTQTEQANINSLVSINGDIPGAHL
jgi:WXG100 family type VII secretion target